MLGKVCAKRSAFVATFAWEAQKAITPGTELSEPRVCRDGGTECPARPLQPSSVRYVYCPSAAQA
jgi:hypothetical protein